MKLGLTGFVSIAKPESAIADAKLDWGFCKLIVPGEMILND